LLHQELADIILRVLDISHWQGIDIENEILKKMSKNEIRGTRGRLK
jgi:NTP pyrophosphatase (non-canonical NTP hydrolase)